jgi:hypothetical protein
VPPLRQPVHALLPVERQEPVDEPGLADGVRPRHEERHLFGRVDTLLGEQSQLDEPVLGRQAKLEPRRAETKVEERLEIYWRTLT